MSTRTNLITTFLIVAFVLTTKAPSFAGKTIYVDDDAAPPGDGTSWETAFTYLQDALADANSLIKPVEIRVAQGAYTPDRGAGIAAGDREVTFQLINSVTIKGGYAGFGQPDPNARDIELYETVLSGDLNGNDIDIHYPEKLMDEPTRAENSYHVVTGSGTDANAVLDGFTVIGGHANSSSPHNQGGGMNNRYGSPTVIDCIFKQNAALDGGGISNYFGDPTLNNCIFNDNGAFYSNLHHSGGKGGGMFNSESSPIVVNCTFSDGYAYDRCGGVYNSGGSPTFTHCEFVENFSRNGGGAGMGNVDSSPILSDCRFNENEGAWGSGGGLCNNQSNVILTNCSFSFNQGPDGGGGMCNGSSSLTLTNCIFISNRADAGSFQFGGGMINGGSTLTLTNCEFRSNKAGDTGGGMYNDWHSVLMLRNCVFTNNEAGRAGGIYNDTSTLTLAECVFINNESSYGSGGGIYNDNDSSSTLLNCIFSENSAYSQWGNGGSGGGMATGNRSNSTVTNCLFTGNSAQYAGGAVHNRSDAIFTNCIFSGNSAHIGGAVNNHDEGSQVYVNCIFVGNLAGNEGGGMHNYDTTPTLINCLFSGNSASSKGGGMYNETNDDWCNPAIINCTFAGNLAPNGNALACDSYKQQYASNIKMASCILWGSGDEIWNNDDSVITITYSNVRGGWPGEGNIDADPRFVEPGYWDANGVWIDGDYHLLPDSPCIDAGDPNYVPEPNETDLDGKPRIINGRIDMGAYEYSPPIPAEVRIVPRTINLASKGKWIAAFLRLPEEYNVTDIDPNSVLLDNEIEPERFWLTEDQQIAIAKFNRVDVQTILEVGEIELTITGRLTDGTPFEAADVIRVLNKTGQKPEK